MDMMRVFAGSNNWDVAKSAYRIARDMEKRIHACMIPWEELDDFSCRENAITGGERDYRENYRENIRALKDVLLKMDEGNEKCLEKRKESGYYGKNAE